MSFQPAPMTPNPTPNSPWSRDADTVVEPQPSEVENAPSLLVACDDRTMRSVLNKAASLEAVDVHWESVDLFAGGEVTASAADAIGRQIPQAGPQCLYCFSHSELDERSADAEGFDGAETAAKPSLLARAQARAARVRRLRARLAEVVAQVAEIPTVAEAIDAGSLTVRGVFYQADSGLFYVCKCGEDGYRCLDAQVI